MKITLLALSRCVSAHRRPTPKARCTDMPVFKCKNKSGKICCRYQFAGPDGTRANQNRITASGFLTKQEAPNAEAERRADALKKHETAGATSIAAALPTSLQSLLAEFMTQYADENLAAKTRERYREMIPYL